MMYLLQNIPVISRLCQIRISTTKFSFAFCDISHISDYNTSCFISPFSQIVDPLPFLFTSIVLNFTSMNVLKACNKFFKGLCKSYIIFFCTLSLVSVATPVRAEPMSTGPCEPFSKSHRRDTIILRYYYIPFMTNADQLIIYCRYNSEYKI